MENLKYNLVFIASAEEETSSENGLAFTLKSVDYKIDYAIVGEPTNMEMAIAEKGLLVLDCTTRGISGHAALGTSANAIYAAVEDINFLRKYKFDKVSELLGPVNISVTMINAGYQHNIVPDKCSFCVDIRFNEFYDHREIIDILSENMNSEIRARSYKYLPSFVSPDNFLVQSGIKQGRKYYGSSTCSDQIHIDFPSFKLGPGDSSRSHIADEFIYLHEIREAIPIYIKILENVLL